MHFHFFSFSALSCSIDENFSSFFIFMSIFSIFIFHFEPEKGELRRRKHKKILKSYQNEFLSFFYFSSFRLLFNAEHNKFSLNFFCLSSFFVPSSLYNSVVGMLCSTLYTRIYIIRYLYVVYLVSKYQHQHQNIIRQRGNTQHQRRE